MRIASLLGAIALCAAAYVFFYRIWGWITTPAQVTILIAAPLAGIASTELAHRLDRSRHFVFFVGYGYGLRVAVAAGLGFGMMFVVGFGLASRGFDWNARVQQPELFVPLGLAVFLAGAASRAESPQRFAPTYRIVGLLVLLLGLWFRSIDGGLSLLHWNETRVQGLYQVLGFIACGAALGLGLKRAWVETTYLAAAMFVVFLYTKFYQWWWDWMPAHLFFLVVGLDASFRLSLSSPSRTWCCCLRPGSTGLMILKRSLA